MVTPHVVKSIEGINIASDKETVYIKDLANIDIINSGLRSVVESVDGTAHILEGLNLDISGKTGTAQVHGKSAHGWFAGFFKKNNKKYVIVAFTENSGSSFYSCKVAYNFLSRVEDLL